MGGLVSVAQGGKFQSGFIAAGFGDLAGPAVDNLAGGNIYLGTAASAVTGGIGSVLGGGKFENGAVTGAFGYLFNDLADHRGLYAGTAGGVLAGGSIAGGCTLASAGICALGPAELLGGGFIGLGILAGETGHVLESIYDGIVNANKVAPDPTAEGPHTTWKENPATGDITRHETWVPNPRNPSGWDSEQSTDLTGKPHYDKGSGQWVPTPHTVLPDGSTRPATPDEIPK